jgi:hypothetical protein
VKVVLDDDTNELPVKRTNNTSTRPFFVGRGANMKALVYGGPGRREWTTRPRPALSAATDAIVRIRAAAPTKAGASQRAQCLMLMLLSPVLCCASKNLHRAADEGNVVQIHLRL